MNFEKNMKKLSERNFAKIAKKFYQRKYQRICKVNKNNNKKYFVKREDSLSTFFKRV